MSAAARPGRTKPPGPVPLGAAVGFLAAYLLVGPVMGVLADRDLPLPGAAATEVAAYYAANPAAAAATAALQVLSVAGLLVFARSVGVSGRVALSAWLAAAAMVVSSLLTGVLTVLVGGVGEATVVLLRQSSFYTGGVVHVVALGGFAVTAAAALHRAGVIGRGVRTFGYVVGVIAMLSVISLAVYYASVLLPLGRVLCMVWTVTAGVSVWRRGRARPAPASPVTDEFAVRPGSTPAEPYARPDHDQ